MSSVRSRRKGPPRRRFAALGLIAVLAGGLLAGNHALLTSAAAADPAPTVTAESLEPCVVGGVTVQFNYLHEGTLVKVQCVDSPKGEEQDYHSDMEPPAGFKIASDWDGYIYVDSSAIGLYSNDIPIERVTYRVDISYTFSGNTIATQPFVGRELGTIIDQSQLSVPNGYQLAAPFAPHEVTGNETLEVELVRALYVVSVVYTVDGAQIGMQGFTDRELASMIVSTDLQIPAGYKLVTPFADYTVAGDARLEVPLAKNPTTPGGDDDDEEEGPKDKAKVPGTVTAEHELAVSGTTGTVSLVALGAALTAIGVGAAIATRIRRTRNA